MAKKIISLLLIVSMLVVGFSIPTSAAVTQQTVDGVKYIPVTTEEEFVAALSEGKNIMLQADIELSTKNFPKGRTFGIGSGIIIDGAGHTLYYKEQRTAALFNFLNSEVLAAGTTVFRNISFGSADTPIMISGSDGLFKYMKDLGCEIVLENVNFYVKKTAVRNNSGAIFTKLGTIVHFRDCVLDVDMTDITDGTLHGGWIGEVVSPGQVEFENCTTIGEIRAPYGAAGFVGQNTTGLLKLTNCKNFANVTAPGYTAGFVANMGAGADATYATDCINYGTITATGTTYDSIAGGIFARVSNRATQATWRVHVVYGCSNYGKITAGDTAGGILGRNHDYDYDGRTFITIGGCENFGAVSGPKYAGGIIGAGTPMAFCTELSDCVNIGEITSENGYAGNFAGVLSGGGAIGNVSVREASVKGGIAAGVVKGANVGAIAGLDSGNYRIAAGTYNGRFISVSTPKYENVIYYGDAAVNSEGITKTEDMSALLAALSERIGADVIAADAGNAAAKVVLAAPVLRGIQLTPVENGVLSIRLIAGIYAKDAYQSYGFDVTVVQADGTVFTKSYNANQLVSEIEAGGSKILADTVAANYLYTAALSGIPADERVTVTVTPVAVSADGTKTYTGTSKMLKITNGKLTNETMAINGVLLENFAIVWESSNKLAEKTLATHLSKRIAELTGAYVPVLSETTKHQRSYEILIGKTNRTESMQIPAGRNIMSLEDSASIVITGDNTAQLGEAVEHFIELLEEKVNASDNAFNITQPIQAPADDDIRLMTFNMGAKDNNIIKQHEWDLLTEYLPEIFTAQEPWAGFLDDFCNNYAVRPDTKFQAKAGTNDEVMANDVNNKAFTGNDYYGIYWGMPRWVPGGLNNQGRASYSVVFYAKDRFTVNEAKSGTFWFSDKPDTIGSKYSESSHPRCATYVTLIDVNTGKEFVVVNVHLDHVNGQIKQATVLMNELIKRVGADTPMMITGDMNSNYTTATIKYMMNNEIMPLTSAEYLAEKAYCGDGPFSGVIDWLFTNTPDQFEFTEYRYCKDFNMFNNLWHSELKMGMPSDHPAVYTEFRLK